MLELLSLCYMHATFDGPRVARLRFLSVMLGALIDPARQFFIFPGVIQVFLLLMT
jgi:hypothetical protein